MNLKDFVAISSLPGLYKLVASRNNGLLIREIDTGKTKFVSSRKHQFTPLESVAIYTVSDSTELAVIFQTIKDKLKDLPLPDIKSSSVEVFKYFKEILPDYDEERVFVSDVKKVIKWYKFLSDRDLLQADEASSAEEAAVESSDDKGKN